MSRFFGWGCLVVRSIMHEGVHAWGRVASCCRAGRSVITMCAPLVPFALTLASCRDFESCAASATCEREDAGSFDASPGVGEVDTDDQTNSDDGQRPGSSDSSEKDDTQMGSLEGIDDGHDPSTAIGGDADDGIELADASVDASEPGAQQGSQQGSSVGEPDAAPSDGGTNDASSEGGSDASSSVDVDPIETDDTETDVESSDDSESDEPETDVGPNDDVDDDDVDIDDSAVDDTSADDTVMDVPPCVLGQSQLGACRLSQ